MSKAKPEQEKLPLEVQPREAYIQEADALKAKGYKCHRVIEGRKEAEKIAEADKLKVFVLVVHYCKGFFSIYTTDKTKYTG